ncbi:MAG: hypothetical protein HY751_11010 [Nitrospinae bacterium]|nr:hypothetical protein [Nitrospinota bacterium]
MTATTKRQAGMLVGILNIFYDEALRISGSEDEARLITQEAMRGFMNQYTASREERLSDSLSNPLALGFN